MIRPLTQSGTRQRPKIGPMDSGRLMTLEEFRCSKEEPGYVYEIMDGVLVVSPNPLPPHDYWVNIARQQLEEYAQKHPRVINWVSEGSEVVIPGRPGSTRPQPDIAVYKDYPEPFPASWDEVCPIVVVEVISNRRELKDTVRNRHLYWMAGGIIEYWIVDPREDNRRPGLTALIKKPGAVEWEEKAVPFGKSYRSTALPKFSLNLRRSGSK